jgi:hypothetical protein
MVKVEQSEKIETQTTAVFRIKQSILFYYHHNDELEE